MTQPTPSTGHTARVRLLAGSIAFVGMLVAPTVLPAQATKASKPKLTPALEQARKYATPGEAHRLLEPIVGSFTTTAKYWLIPGREPVRAEGTIESQWILDGRFVDFGYKTELFGEPYEGRARIGYDNYAKKYVATWVDTHSTSVLRLEGQCDAGCKTRTMETTFTDPVSAQPVKLRDVTTILDQTSFRYEAFLEFPGGQKLKQAEITATRRR